MGGIVILEDHWFFHVWESRPLMQCLLWLQSSMCERQTLSQMLHVQTCLNNVDSGVILLFVLFLCSFSLSVISQGDHIYQQLTANWLLPLVTVLRCFPAPVEKGFITSDCQPPVFCLHYIVLWRGGSNTKSLVKMYRSFVLPTILKPIISIIC